MAKILVVDDDPTTRGVLRSILSDEGHTVVEAANGDIGLQQFDKEQPALVLLDIFMPKKAGLDTLREILDRKPGQPIVVVSGGSSFTSFEALEWASEIGARRVLPKPIDRAELVQVVRDIL